MWELNKAWPLTEADKPGEHRRSTSNLAHSSQRPYPKIRSPECPDSWRRSYLRVSADPSEMTVSRRSTFEGLSKKSSPVAITFQTFQEQNLRFALGASSASSLGPDEAPRAKRSSSLYYCLFPCTNSPIKSTKEQNLRR